MTATTRVDRPQEARPPSGSTLFVVCLLTCIKGNVQRTSVYVYIKSSTVYCMSPRRNGFSNPSLASECAPSPRTGGGGAESPAGEGLGESQFRRLEKKLSTLPTLWSSVIEQPATGSNC